MLFVIHYTRCAPTGKAVVPWPGAGGAEPGAAGLKLWITNNHSVLKIK